MEQLAISQTEIFDSLVKLLTNIKKDGADRKTIDYCKRKLEILENYWREYQRNHRKCCEVADFSHVYFTKNCFDKAEEVYLSIKQLITKTMENLLSKQKGPQQPPVEAGTSKQDGISSHSQEPQQQLREAREDSKLEEMIKKQTIHFRAFMRTVATIEIDQLKNKWEFDDALKSLQSRWTIIDTLHWDIEGENGDEDVWYQEEFNRYEKMYNDLKKTISSKMWSVSHREKATPQMDIPTFHGNYHQWTSFKDLFTEAIHKNPSLSNAQKMQFLKGKLSGEAERLVHHLQISSENYDVCWEILNHRYGNNRLIFTSHVNILLNIPSMQQQSIGAIKKLHDVTKECLHAIQNLGVDITTWDPLLVLLLAQKLDSETFAEYIESVKNPRELPVLQEFLDFLENKFTALEASRRKQETNNQKINNQLPNQNYQANQNKYYRSNNNHQSSNKNYSNSMKNHTKSLHVSRSITCALCSADHGLWMCTQFLQMSDEQKLKTVNQLNCCANCLYNHFNKPCLSNKTCRKCHGKHNSLLHDAIITKNRLNTSAKPNHKAANTLATSCVTNDEQASASTHVSWNDMSETLLATALVEVPGHDGTYHTMRALIDQGSQVSLISEKAAQVLKIQRSSCKGTVFGIGEKENNCKGVMIIRIKSIYSEFALEGEVLIMNKLINNLPIKSFIKPNWPHIQNINLADPEFNTSRPVDLLLGADVYCKIALGGLLRGDSEDQPIAQQTQLGWLLCGTMTPRYRCNVILHNTDDLRRFWENEDIAQQPEMSTEDHECLQYFLSTTQRLENGRYQVRLPFKPETKDQLGSTKPIALAQFRNLERKLEKDMELKTEYKKFMNEYYNLNHMIPCVSAKSTKPECYLPHHGVTRAESTTTKLRVVFNASARSLSGYSLNDVMYRGPNLQQDLQELILKWRQYQFVYTADIEKMYRQIMVHPEDQSYQKILWRDSPLQPIQTYQLTTITYGTKPAPFLAMMCLKQLAAEEKQNFPDAAKALEECFYMDDYCGGASTIEQAKQLKIDLIKLLSKGGFNLRKWDSNEPKLLADLDKDLLSQQIYEFKQSDSKKTLGLGWNPQQDKFIFDSKLEPISLPKPTKRSLLSDISKIFDPLGWLTPLTITMKMLFQSVWSSNLNWDDALPEDIKIKWLNLRGELKDINTIEVKRWLGIKINHSLQLHGFCDASNKAYAAVIYCKVINENNANEVTLVAAKARLMPVSKDISIPRLELMGAQLLSQLMQKVQTCLESYNPEIYCWTDSTAVLGWIQGAPERWKPFVSNRVKAITKIIPKEKWNYVKTIENPADCASRGLRIKQLKNHNLWWQGPSWIPSFQNHEIPQTTYETSIEIKQSNVVVAEKHQETTMTIHNIINHLLSKMNSFAKIVRVFAWILRLPTAKAGRQPYLTLHELRRAKLLIIKTVQRMEFTSDINQLLTNGNVHSKSKLLPLHPIIDQEGILRVGGRLRNAHIGAEMKHPIILPHNHRLTTLIIQYAHELTYHGGARLTLSNILQNYWIISGYSATKKVIRQCIICKKQEPIRKDQLMGDLPSSRVNPERAFHHCGVDYTGFVEVKANKGRGIKTTKGYIAIFVCMVTKAVHLELVSDLSSSAFLAVINRMAARRGAPRHIYSDNGTNFVGANRMLQEEYDHLQNIFNESFFKEITELQIEWHFNAPSWPQAGGLWERAVRSLKHHLKRVIGQQKLTFEEYTTLLAKLEACLNSRPICALSEDPEDLNFLTPAHFLSARPGLTIIDTADDARTRWHLVSKLFEDLWKRWKTEYLTQLSTRNKWKRQKKNINVGDLVMIHDDNLPPGKWPMGRVTEVHPGKDDLIRVVTLKTKNGYIKRPVVKLSVLPLDQTEPDIPKEQPLPQNNEPEKEPRNHQQSNTRMYNTYPKVVNIALSLLLLLGIFILPTTASYNITTFDTNKTLYFDTIGKVQLIRDKWKLVTYFDMSPYWQGDKAIKDFTRYLDRTCETMIESSHCYMVLLQIRHNYNELQYYNQLLLSQHYGERLRTRRGLINAVGSIANSLFGVLDESFAEKYKQDIELVHRNQKHQGQLWKNLTSIVENEHNVLQRTEDIIAKQHKTINKHLLVLDRANSKLQQEIDVMTAQLDFTLVSITTINMMQNLKQIQETLIDTISEIYHGQISLHLLTPPQLKRELHIIYGQMPQDLTLPIENIETDFERIYKLLRTKARVTEKYIIFEITFPLIARESFQLYRIIPVPKQINYTMKIITPISEYVAVNLKKDAFFIPTIHDLDTCLYHGQSFICELFTPIQNLENDENFCEISPINQRCKTETTSCKNRWVELHSTSQYLYFCCDTYSIKIICDDQVTVRQLTRAGVISMTQKCFIKSKDFTLYSLQQQSNQLHFSPDMLVPELDQINHIVNITIPTETTLPEDMTLNKSLSILGDQIRTLKTTKAEVDDVSVHDIHQYTIMYILLGVVLCAAAVWIGRRASCCSLSAACRAQPHRRQESEVTTSSRTRANSEVQTRKQSNADRQQSESEQIGLSSYFARRWPSAMRSAGTQKTMLTTARKERVFTVEDSLV